MHRMTPSVRFAALVLLISAFPLLTGCATTRQLEFSVVDLETGEAIEGASVRIEQGAGDVPYGPKTHETTTDERGVVSVGAEDKPFVAITAAAPSYITERFRILDPHADAQPEPAFIGTVEPTGRRAYKVRLLHGPEAVVTLLVPDGFEGAIMLDYRATDDWQPGKRGFLIAVEDGRAALPAAPALDVAHRFEARTATGERIPGPIGSWDETEPRASQVRLRGPIDGVRVPMYVIGDLEDFKRVMRRMYP